MGAIQQIANQASIVSGTVRNLSVPSCRLTAEDLRRLYKILDKKAHEAAELQARMLVQGGLSNEQFEGLGASTRSLLKLTVRVQGISGEWLGSDSDQPLLDELLPIQIATVEFHSAFMFRGQLKLEPNNSFTLTLDFTRTSVLDMTNLLLAPMQNRSIAVISGTDNTWVNGVCEELRLFFDERKTARSWLHSKYAYDALLFPVGFPLSLILVNRLDRWLHTREHMSEAVSIAIYVYIVLVTLLVFRLIFNYAKWVLPKLEGPNRIHGLLLVHKIVLGVISTTLIGTVVTIILKLIGLPA